jgi:hypothetical protein
MAAADQSPLPRARSVDSASTRPASAAGNSSDSTARSYPRAAPSLSAVLISTPITCPLGPSRSWSWQPGRSRWASPVANDLPPGLGIRGASECLSPSGPRAPSWRRDRACRAQPSSLRPRTASGRPGAARHGRRWSTARCAPRPGTARRADDAPGTQPGPGASADRSPGAPRSAAAGPARASPPPRCAAPVGDARAA